jgi:YbbR domain-containing protein
MFRWISLNYRTFLWALALAVAVWIAAVTAADPDETRQLPNPVPVEIIGQDPSLVVNSDIPREVEITLRAPHSVWNGLDADPSLVHVILDLSGLSAGEHTSELQIQVDARPVQILATSPKSVSFSLESIATKPFPVDVTFSGESSVGYQIGEAMIEPAEVIVAGAQSQVEKVARTHISVDLDGVRENVDQTLTVEVLDANGEPVEGVTVSPEAIHVSLPVSQQGGYRDVAVKVIMAGRVASGYRLTDISVFPPVVTIYAADPELVNNLPGVVETAPLDLQNAKEDINTRLALNLPEGVTIVGDQTVLIQTGVSAIESSITLDGEKVEIIGLENGLTAIVSPLTVDVIVSGPLPILDTITHQDVRITVDLTNLEIGTHQVIPRIEVLISDVIVESILPNTIEVVISVAGIPTITPTP